MEGLGVLICTMIWGGGEREREVPFSPPHPNETAGRTPTCQVLNSKVGTPESKPSSGLLTGTLACIQRCRGLPTLVDVSNYIPTRKESDRNNPLYLHIFKCIPHLVSHSYTLLPNNQSRSIPLKSILCHFSLVRVKMGVCGGL